MLIRLSVLDECNDSTTRMDIGRSIKSDKMLKDEHDFKRYLKFGEVYRSFDLIEPLEQYKVGDNFYKEVYVFSEDSSAPLKNIKEVYFAKNFGVVQYTTKDGREFHLLNNELTEVPK